MPIHSEKLLHPDHIEMLVTSETNADKHSAVRKALPFMEPYAPVVPG
jgi:hypothetical protein